MQQTGNSKYLGQGGQQSIASSMPPSIATPPGATSLSSTLPGRQQELDAMQLAARRPGQQEMSGVPLAGRRSGEVTAASETMRAAMSSLQEVVKDAARSDLSDAMRAQQRAIVALREGFPLGDDQQAQASTSAELTASVVRPQTFDFSSCEGHGAPGSGAAAAADAACAEQYLARERYVGQKLESIKALQAMAMHHLEQASASGELAAARVLTLQREAANSRNVAVARARVALVGAQQASQQQAAAVTLVRLPAAEDQRAAPAQLTEQQAAVAAAVSEFRGMGGLQPSAAANALQPEAPLPVPSAQQAASTAVQRPVQSAVAQLAAAPAADAGIQARPAMVSDALAAMRASLRAFAEAVGAGHTEVTMARNKQHSALLALLAAFPVGNSDTVLAETQDAEERTKPVVKFDLEKQPAEADLHGLQKAAEAKVHAESALSKLDAAAAGGSTPECNACQVRVQSVILTQRSVLSSLDSAEASKEIEIQKQLKELEQKQAALKHETDSGTWR